jgi:hypothetical protein
MLRRLPLLAALLLATLLRAEAPPPVPGLEPLDDNGRSFQTQRQRVPLRVLDAPDLLSLSNSDQAALLDRAADAGFNTVSFEAPLVGPQGLSRDLGRVDPSAAAAWTRAFEALQFRRLYALPVLWTPASIDALVGTPTARAQFFGGKNALGWQAWALRQAAGLKVKGRPLNATPGVAGWILYRGAWPDAPPLPGRAVGVSNTAEARLRGWARWQVQVARRLGYQQRLGLGLWAKSDLGPSGPTLTEPDNSGSGGAPFAELSSPNLVVDTSPEHAKALDILPPVPGSDAELVGQLDDSANVKAPPANPWDLEGLDWEAVESLFSSFPLASQIDFLELTLDSEDWYRVSERLAEAAQTTEVPVLWRQDWRTASRYERNKRLAPPSPLAGLEGAWPADDWPPTGESLWSSREAPSPETAAFRMRSARVLKQGKGLVLSLQLNRPAAVIASYGPSLPLEKQSGTKPGERPKAEVVLPLPGIAPGSAFLLKVQALSPSHGAAILRTRWVRAPK